MNITKPTRLLVAGIVLAVASTVASADVIKALVDLGNGQGMPTSPDSNGNYWNQVKSLFVSPVSLTSNTNTLTGWTLNITVPSGGPDGTANFTGAGLNALSTGAPADFAVSGAYNDGWYDNNVSGLYHGTFTYQGLDPATTYSLRLWGSRQTASTNNWINGTVTVTTGNAADGPTFTLLDGSLGNVLTLSLTPNSSGTFAFELKSTGSTGATNVNAMSLETVVPEPGTLALLAFGSMAIMKFRRKSVSK